METIFPLPTQNIVVYTGLVHQNKESMRLQSSVFQDGEKIPDSYTCRGEGFNPPLTIEDVPLKTQSLALLVDDPDSPGGIFTHWLVWNINPDQILISENSIPGGAMQGENSGGRKDYYPPCPHSGTHHYFFRLYALDCTLDLKGEVDREKFITAIQTHTLATAQIMGTCSV